MSDFRTTRPKIAPRWLTEGEGGLVGYALDIVKDAFAERVRLGLMARLPQQEPAGVEVAPPEALAALGRDRRVTRGFVETDQSYAARLLRWLDDRKSAGNPFALMQKLSEYVGPGPWFRTVDARGNWYELDANGVRSYVLDQANWDWDGLPVADRWARFWIIIYPEGLWTQTQGWNDATDTGAWGENGGTWGSNATIEEVRTIRSIVADWKPAGTRCVNIIVAFDNTSFDPTAPEPDGLWEHWSKVDAGVRVPARLSTAIYWDGV